MFIVKVPGINGGEKGCRNSGNAIISELKKIQVNESGKDIAGDSADVEEIHVNNSDLTYSDELISENSLEIFEAKQRAIFLGGDHSITYSIGKSFLEYCEKAGKNPCLIIFDSHPNCKKTNSILQFPARPPRTKDDAKFQTKENLPTNTNWLRKLIESGFPAKNILLVGVRNSEAEERNFLKEKGVAIMQMGSFSEDFDDACDGIMEFSSNKQLYVSIDISVLDPAFAPATEFQESGGFTGREFVHIVQRISKIKNLKAVDISEINELKDQNKMTVKIGAKILSELI